ncbi:MAG: hypothetical protein ABI461_22050 [Polyangiaceae bacterium]
MKRVSVAASALTLLVVFLSGCQRGCLSSWWESHTHSGNVPPQLANSTPDEKPGCISGFVRCTGGAVQVSRADPNAHCSPEGCLCPWDGIARCDRGCVEEGVPVEMPSDAGAAQLCLPALDAGEIVAREETVDVGDAGEISCEMEGYLCLNGRVSSCESPKVAVCTHGCAPLDDVRLDTGEDLQAAALILCARR